MKRSHQAMFNRAFEAAYQRACEAGMDHNAAEAWAADQAWIEYERYCDDKLHEKREGGA